MKIHKILLCVIASISVLVVGCSKTVTPGDYDSSEVGKIKKVVPGVILSKRPVNIHNKAAESSTVPNTDTNAPNTDTDIAVNKPHGFEYVIRLNSGVIISVVQTENLNLDAKQHVLVIYGNNTRVVADEGSDQ